MRLVPLKSGGHRPPLHHAHGALANGSALRRSLTSRGIQVHGASRPHVDAGHRTALNLGGVEVTETPRGQVLVEPGTLEPTRILDAEIELLADARPLRHGARVRMHQGTAEVMARVGLAPLDAGDTLAPGARGFVRIRTEGPIALTRGDRFILRAYSPTRTIAATMAPTMSPGTTLIRKIACHE